MFHFLLYLFAKKSICRAAQNNMVAAWIPGIHRALRSCRVSSSLLAFEDQSKQPSLSILTQSSKNTYENQKENQARSFQESKCKRRGPPVLHSKYLILLLALGMKEAGSDETQAKNLKHVRPEGSLSICSI